MPPGAADRRRAGGPALFPRCLTPAPPYADPVRAGRRRGVSSGRFGADIEETRMRRPHRAGVLAIVLVVLLVTPALAEDERPWWALSTSFNYSVGNYGTGKDTTFIYVPFTLGVKPIDGLTLSLTVPYVYQTGETVVITGGGVAVRKDKQRQLKTATQN